MNRLLIVSLVLVAAVGCRRHHHPEDPNAAGGNGAGMGVAPPAATACGQYQACCAAMAVNPNLAALQMQCAQVAQLSALGPQGEAACSASMMGLRQALTAMPGGAPPACLAGGAMVPGMPVAGRPMMPGMPGMPVAPTMPTAPMMPGVPTAAGAAGVIAVGQTVSGQLVIGDQVVAAEGGRLADDYTVMLTAGMPVQIDTRGGPSIVRAGSTLDVVTALICNGNQVARDDDGGGYPNSRINYTPVATGPCTIRVMGFSGDQGAYTLQVQAGSPGAGAAMVPGVAGGAAGVLVLGQTQQGVLMTGDTVVEGGRLGDDYSMALTAGVPVTIVTRGGASTVHVGSNVDVVTALICNGVEVARDDDSAGSLNSRIVYTPTATGVCTVRVMGFSGDQGAYTVQTYQGALDNQT